MPPEWPDGQKSHHQARVCTPPDRSHTRCRASASIIPHERTLAALTGGTGWQYSSRVPALPHIYQYFLFLINMSYIFIIRQVKHFPKKLKICPTFLPITDYEHDVGQREIQEDLSDFPRRAKWSQSPVSGPRLSLPCLSMSGG